MRTRSNCGALIVRGADPTRRLFTLMTAWAGKDVTTTLAAGRINRSATIALRPRSAVIARVTSAKCSRRTVTVAVPQGIAARSMGVDPSAMFPQDTVAPAGLVVTRATQSRGAGAGTASAGAAAVDGGATSGGTTTDATTAGGAFEPGLNAFPTSSPPITHDA